MRTLYTADFVLTMDPGNTVITDGALLVDGMRIVAVGPAADLAPGATAVPGTEVRALNDRLVMPGLVNTHLPRSAHLSQARRPTSSPSAPTRRG